MTREEAIIYGKEQLAIFGGEHAEFIKLAIEALEKEPCEDCVSRKEVHEMLENVPINPNDKWFNWLQKACLRLADLPSVKQEPKLLGTKNGKRQIKSVLQTEISGYKEEQKQLLSRSVDEIERSHGYGIMRGITMTENAIIKVVAPIEEEK